jgi:hypothetical protein
VPHFPRFRALALFGRRLQERADSVGIPASKNLVWGLGSQAENSQHAIFSFNSISLFDCRGHRAAPVQFRFLERRFDMRDLGAVLDHEGSLPHPARDQVP